MTLQWHIHDDGYMWAQGSKGRYEISDGGGGNAILKLPIGVLVSCDWEGAKPIAEGCENDVKGELK